MSLMLATLHDTAVSLNRIYYKWSQYSRYDMAGNLTVLIYDEQFEQTLLCQLILKLCLFSVTILTDKNWVVVIVWK